MVRVILERFFKMFGRRSKIRIVKILFARFEREVGFLYVDERVFFAQKVCGQRSAAQRAITRFDMLGGKPNIFSAMRTNRESWHEKPSDAILRL